MSLLQNPAHYIMQTWPASIAAMNDCNVLIKICTKSYIAATQNSETQTWNTLQ